MKQTPKALIALAVILIFSLLVTQGTEDIAPVQQRLLAGTYFTTPTRTSNVNKYCPANLNRSSLASPSDYTNAESQRKQVNSQLNIDG